MTAITEGLSAALADRYRLERQLGAGGMATVYLAHDVRHDRRVAVKVLRPELAAVIGAERFLAEIKTTANLQHPHVLPLFDSGQVEGTVFYVMPFVDGESLRDRITRESQLPIDDALRIAREVGDALHYAHGHGVIHRDIKPENILLQGGHALVADFGIALAASRSGGNRMTETGMSLGTPRYMSPEQAMGERTIDARTDVYALGCVLYEMLTGDAPFTGSTAQAIVAKVLTERPAAIIPRRDRVPPHVEDAVLTALEKLPADRFATAGELVAALNGAATGGTTIHARARAGRRAASASMVRRAAVAVGIAILALAGGWRLGRGTSASASVPPARLAVLEPGYDAMFSGVSRTIDISADGELVVFGANNGLGPRVLARPLDGGAVREVPNSANASHLRLSPDGQSLYAGLQGTTMHRVSLSGGTWAPVPGLEQTSFLAFGDNGTLWWASLLSYGSYRRGSDGRDSLVFPRTSITQVLPGGRHGIGVGISTGANSGVAQWLDLRTGAVAPIFDIPVVEVRYTMGYLVYVRPDGVLVAVEFNPRTGAVTGPHAEVASNVSVAGIGFAQFAVSENGTAVFVPGFNNDLVRVNREGHLRVLLSEYRRYHSPRISPDGSRVAYDDVRPEGRDVWLHTQGTSAVTRATFHGDGHDPAWSLDGRGLIYLAGSEGKLDVFTTRLGTTLPPSQLGARMEIAYTGTPLRDGSILTTIPGITGRGLDIIRISADGVTIDTVLATAADESFVTPSPDGRWFAYISDVSGRPEVYIRALGRRESHVQLQVSLEGATEPVWSRNGREIFYRSVSLSGTQLVAAALDLGDAPRVVRRTALFDVSGFDTSAPHANYDVSPDGTWFVFARRGGSNHVVVLQNVPEMARRIARTGATR